MTEERNRIRKIDVRLGRVPSPDPQNPSVTRPDSGITPEEAEMLWDRKASDNPRANGKTKK